jgi:tetratricopeptide (TPR) repeat protein
MRSFFPPLVATPLLCTGTALAQISVTGNNHARQCFIEAASDGANSASCDKSPESEMLVGRDRAATDVNRAVVHTNAGNLRAALRGLKRAESLRPELGEIYASRGNVFFYQSSYEEALAEYDRGIAAGMKRLHAAHFDRGLALEQLGRLHEAKEAYRQSIALAPEFDLAKARLSRLSRHAVIPIRVVFPAVPRWGAAMLGRNDSDQ